MIRLESINKYYRSARRTLHAIDSVSLLIPKGSFYTLVGPSGSGKTTTLRLVAGLERHDKGRITLENQVVADPGLGQFVPTSQRAIGMVFQSYAIWPHLDVFNNVGYPLQNRKVSRAEVERRVSEVLELVGMRDLMHVPAPMLSGGQQQRVALARALVSRPEVLLLDEPLSNLDAQLRERMRTEIRDIQRNLGITTLYVTHDRAEALSMSTTVAVMNKGRVEMTGTPREIYEEPRSLFTAEFLGQSNIVEGKVAELLPNSQLIVETVHGRLLCRTAPGRAVGEKVQLLIRPEDISISPATAITGGRWTGKLSAATFYGERLDCVVELNGVALRCFAARQMSTLCGQTVTVDLVPESLWALSDEESRS